MRLRLLPFLVALPFAAIAAAPGLHPEEAYPDNIPPMASPGPYTAFIKQVQEKLHGYGFDAGPISGDFGPKTQAALAQFQLSRLVPASGMLDEGTLSELGVERAAEQSDSAAASSAGIPDWQTLVDDAATIETGQRALRAAGYDAGPADGTLNARTVAAVKQAQKDHARRAWHRCRAERRGGRFGARRDEARAERLTANICCSPRSPAPARPRSSAEWPRAWPANAWAGSTPRRCARAASAAASG